MIWRRLYVFIMQKDSLNIELHTKELILKALNSTNTIRAAAKLLGVSESGLHRLMGLYKIEQIWVIR